MRHLSFIILFTTVCTFAFAQKKDITLEDIWTKNTFKIKTVLGFNAMKDGKRYTQLDKDGETQRIRIYDLQSGKAGDVLFDNTATTFPDGKKLVIDDYSFSADEKKILLKTESEAIYRRSILYRVYAYDIEKKSLHAIDEAKVLHATFSPDGNKVAYVKTNNLYIRDLTNNNSVAVTTDGKWNEIINGNCDWVYEEEFGFTRAFDWSADGKYIAYYRFDESSVPLYIMPKYTGTYPNNYTYKYPKAGESNSTVQIKLYDVTSKTTVTADCGTEADQYIPRIKWTKAKDQLCIYRLNRLQNKLELLMVNALTGQSQVVYTDENKYYIGVNDEITFLADGQSFIFSTERDGNNHLYKYDWNKKSFTNLTNGAYDIESIISVDEKKKVVYYTAAEASPMERKLYAVGFDGKGKKALTSENGTHAITAIAGNEFFLDKYSTLSQPPVYYLRSASGKIIRTLEDNKDLADKMKEYNLGKIAFKKVDLPDGRSFNAWTILPPDFSESKKYPVLMYQYSGPGSQDVADKFPIRDFFWHQMLAQKGYIVFCADGTGTGFRGEEFKKKTYLQLGKLESEDQISFAKYLGNLPYVDKNRIGIWGWSYGGFMSATCILKGNDVFKAAVSVAPVTNWRYYDNIYTERFMRTPIQNPGGYDDNAPEKMAGQLKGKLLIIHGTADDNVHFQNAVMLTDALINANKGFESEYYPNKAHGISGGNTRLHLYNRMTDFILSNL